MFWVGLIFGLIVGGGFGYLLAALMRASKNEGDEYE